ncbi:ASKHA domain-containing protein [Methanoregula sp. UBA64]|jgi:uncharacterized 2Fe-2S/4Fe-4S cluster protein (DUF4445 family)|uniref:ASKHA domain-containing protein n=1 Tax=Methanoregula sp. UBA64 TaxID=1915554 RepID=UPI0025D2EA97|nr:ASKHA domain-containing protein [Methanoregula sp. UBA64]
MADTVTLTFEPDGKTVTDNPKSILETAQGAGIALRGECGGVGVCGKCRVQITKSYGTLSPVTEKETKLLTPAELAGGMRLACQARVLAGKATVFVPPESRNEAREISGTALEGHAVLGPAVKKIACSLPRPTLADTTPDLERLAAALGRDLSGIPLPVLANLPGTLRAGDWTVTAVFWKDEPVAIESGDTTEEMYGLAIDVGSSKIICHLLNLATGKTVAQDHAENPQVMYGEDIVSRITFAAKAPENTKKLQSLVVGTINTLVARMCEGAGIPADRIYECVFDGNTVMHHLLLGIDTKYIGISPFLPALKSPVSVPAREIGLSICPEGKVTSLPLIAGYVGSDAVADLMLTRIYERTACSLVIDIGTNSELMLGNSQRIVVCSAPSGPSFEGAQISSGMKAVGGAIETFAIRDGRISYTTIGGKKPKGICGSGVIDLVAELYSAGIITKTGKFADLTHPRIKKPEGSVPVFVVAPGTETESGRDITVTEKDINEFLLAKGSLRAGWTILAEKYGIDPKTLDRVYLAGSFGTHINIKNAMALELLPQVPEERVVLAGETAVGGSKLALLSLHEREAIRPVLDRVEYVELSVEKSFNREYLRSIPIYHMIAGRQG